MSEDQYTGGELVAYTPTARTVDLRDRATDSWTDVLVDVIKLARGIAPTEFVPAGLRCTCRQDPCRCGGVEKTTAAILNGRELGLAPLTALSSTHVIEGRPGVSAEMMRGLILRAGHELAIKSQDRTRCEIWGRRQGTEEWSKAIWTIDEARQTVVRQKDGWKPLTEKSNWKSYPADMLLARATTRLARMLFADVIHGMRSTEELRDMSDVIDGEVVEEAPPVAAPVQRRRAPRPSPRVAAAEAQEKAPEPEAETPAVEPQEPASQPVQRRRAPRPTPRTQPAQPAAEAAPEPVEAEVDTLPEADEVVEAEVVEDQEKPVEEKPVDLMSQRAIGMVQQHWSRLGVEQRAERLWYAGVVVGREISSHKELMPAELRKLMGVLERARDISAIDALVKGDES